MGEGGLPGGRGVEAKWLAETSGQQQAPRGKSAVWAAQVRSESHLCVFQELQRKLGLGPQACNPSFFQEVEAGGWLIKACLGPVS